MNAPARAPRQDSDGNGEAKGLELVRVGRPRR